MTPDEAILSQETYLRSPLCNLTQFERKASKLGIKALKRHRDRGTLTFSGMLEPLPGETPNDTLSLTREAKRKLHESPLGREPRN